MANHLFLVHCGFYDSELGDGIYESHTNFFVVADSFESARSKIKENQQFKLKRMHVDGIQQIEAVDGFRLNLNEDPGLLGRSEVISHKHRELAPKKV